MTLACLVLLCLVLLVLCATAVRLFALTPRDRLIRQHLLKRYVVTVEAGETFCGLLAAVDARTIVLREVSVLMKDGTSTAVDGEVVLRRESVSYLQLPPA